LQKEKKMNYRHMFMINAFIAALLGLGFLIVPGRILNPFLVDEYAETQMILQFFGTAMLGLGLLLWFAKDVSEADLQKGMGIALLTGAVGGLMGPVIGGTSEALSASWWIAMVVYAILGLAHAYLLFQKPKQLTRA
jgi:hypothetical protein